METEEEGGEVKQGEAEEEEEQGTQSPVFFSPPSFEEVFDADTGDVAVLSLPVLSASLLRATDLIRLRFERVEQGLLVLPILARDICIDLHHQFSACSVVTHPPRNPFTTEPPSFVTPGIFLTGPQGVGKSYAIYSLVATLTSKPDKYRVSYVPDCGKWLVDTSASGIKFLLHEWVWAFAQEAKDQTLIGQSGKTVLQLAQEVITPPFPFTRDQALNEMREALKEYCISRDLIWVHVYDQINHIYKDQRQHVWPYSLAVPRAVAGYPEFYIISASANNEHDIQVPTSSVKPFYIMETASIRLSPAELRVQLEKYLPVLREPSQRDDYKGVVEKLLYCTACLPLRVAQVFTALKERAPANPMAFLQVLVDEQFRKWKWESRGSQRRHVEKGQYIKGYSESVLQAAVAALLRAPIAGLGGMLEYRNKQLTAIIKSRGIEYIIPLGPAEEVGLQHLQTHDVYDTAVNVMLRSDTLTNDAKGRLLERYIIDTMQKVLRKDYVLTTTRIQKHPTMETATAPTTTGPGKRRASELDKGKVGWGSTPGPPIRIPGSQLSMEGHILPSSPGSCIPPSFTMPTMLIPSSSNFPDADLFMLTPTAQPFSLYAFQVSVIDGRDVAAKVGKNKYFVRRDSGQLSTAAEMALYTGIPVEKHQLIFILLKAPTAPNKFEGRDYVDVVTLESLQDLFPSVSLYLASSK
jgi:hypothetical protein